MWRRRPRRVEIRRLRAVNRFTMGGWLLGLGSAAVTNGYPSLVAVRPDYWVTLSYGYARASVGAPEAGPLVRCYLFA